ncbi:MAG: histone deacetylase family protein [Gammaproteobacteria bacterium]|nr:histone deacetylase family protein [Gammaproteobacteria bacterium]
MTALITHSACLEHEMDPGHPECPERLSTVLGHLGQCGILDEVDVYESTLARRSDLARVHAESYLDALDRVVPESGLVHVTLDTAMGPRSLDAAKAVAGAAVDGVKMVLKEREQRVFCAVRPPGHHAEESAAMGFCFLNGIAVAAMAALEDDRIDRVAVLDFDVHHGNGTVAAFMDNPSVLACSSFQHPHYPYRYFDVDRPNIVNTPLPAGTRGIEFRNAVERDWLPALDDFKPQLILVSAGFDGHADDPLGDFLLTQDDFAWVTGLVTDAANRHAEGRIVSVLEGGYDLVALARSVAAHLEVLGSRSSKT